MRILDAEMDLREETRATEQAHEALATDEYIERANVMSVTQNGLNDRLNSVIVDIKALPDGEAQFGKELQILGQAAQVMAEATGILAEPDTGPQAIAAETEVIELLLQSKRANPKGGGGGGSSPGGGGSGDTDRPALALYGPGADLKAQFEDRGVQQTTGNAGISLPAEFRDGLDAFFNAVETIQ